MSLWTDEDRKKANERRKRSINRRGSSPPAERGDPWLSSAGDGPGDYYRHEENRDDD